MKKMVIGVYIYKRTIKLRDNFIKHGRMCLKHFSWDKCASETISVYKELWIKNSGKNGGSMLNYIEMFMIKRSLNRNAQR